MSNFSQPISFVATYEQFNSIWPEMEKMGYSKTLDSPTYNSGIMYVTNQQGNDELITDYAVLTSPKYEHNRIHIPEFNPELILAIAAMREGGNMNCREYYTDSENRMIYPGVENRFMWKATLSEILDHFGYELKGKDVVKIQGIESECTAIVNKRIKQMKEDNFPEKWALKCENKEQAQEFLKWVEENKQTPISYTIEDVTKTFFNYPAFYDPHPSYDNCHGLLNVQKGYTEITYDQWYNHYIKNMKTQRKIIGFKLIQEYPGSPDLGIVLSVNPLLCADDNLCYYSGILRPEYACTGLTIGVLKKNPNYWKPIYEEEKRIITLKCEGGTFELEVSKEGIYYSPEKLWLDINDLKHFLNGNHVSSTHSNSRHAGTGKMYLFKPVLIDSGCKKNVPVADFLKVLEAYDEFNK